MNDLASGKREKSPISATRESRDRGYPAQAFEGFHGCRDIVLAGALGYCPVEPVPLQGQRPHIFAAFLENELLLRSPKEGDESQAE